MEPDHQDADEWAQPRRLGIILQNIDELVEAIIASNDSAVRQHAASSDDSLLRAHQSSLLKGFKDTMVSIQSKAAKAIHEVESKIALPTQTGHSQAIASTSLDDLPGFSPGNELNRVLGRQAHTNGKYSYKLRDFAATTSDIQLIAEDGGAAPIQQDEGPVVMLQPTLRNVWVIQHAHAKLLNHKESLIKQYLALADLDAGTSRKFSREYYEDLSLANLPSKNKLGNLLDVKRSSFNNTAHDLTIILIFKAPDGRLEYVEAVTGDTVSTDANHDSTSYLALPANEASIKKLYDVYRSLRKGTSEQRRASKDKEFAAKLPVDAMDELEKQFSFAGGGQPEGTAASSRKRRRMLEDDEGRD
ncbi:hypothetical protein AAE478_009125 [Parahypoxylon ruwenzoriense]